MDGDAALLRLTPQDDVAVALRRVAEGSGLAVAGGPRGATIGSFASASLAPPLVTFNVTHGTRFHEALQTAPSFAVHLLAEDQAPLASRFAAPDLDAQLDGVAHTRTPLGLPCWRTRSASCSAARVARWRWATTRFR